jgi:hypothetical protein
VDKYLHRIVNRVHERGRLSDEDWVQWSTTPFVFDRSEATFKEKQCLDWVKSMSPPRPEADVPPDLDEDEDGGDGFSKKKLGKLFVRGPRGRGATASRK